MDTTAERMAAAWFAALMRLCEVTPKGHVATAGDAVALVTGCAVPGLNAAISRTPDPQPASLEALAKTADDVRDFGLPWSIIVRGPASDAAAALAARYGLTARGEMPFMVCAAGDAVLRAGDELIRPVGSGDNAVYTEVLTAGFAVPEGTFGSLMGGGVLDAAEITGYLADRNHRPVATGLGIHSPGAVGVFNIAVVPGERSRGLGRAMTARVIADGFAAGAQAAYLNPSAQGRALYESMGFRLTETWTTFTAP